MVLFIRELAEAVAAAEAAGKRPTLESFERRKIREEVVGTISDPGLLAVIALFEERKKAFFEKWPSPLGAVADSTDALFAGMDVKDLRDVMFFEIRRAFTLNPVDVPLLGLRRDGVAVVVVKIEEDFQTAIVIGLMDGMALHDCGNSACPIHGHGHGNKAPAD